MLEKCINIYILNQNEAIFSKASIKYVYQNELTITESKYELYILLIWRL